LEGETWCATTVRTGYREGRTKLRETAENEHGYVEPERRIITESLEHCGQPLGRKGRRSAEERKAHQGEVSMCEHDAPEGLQTLCSGITPLGCLHMHLCIKGMR
jgi:hypothetical protein